MFSLRRLTLTAAVFISPFSFAIAADDETVVLDKVMVTASRHPESIAAIPYNVQVIEQSEIQRQSSAGQDLGSILGQLVPGLAPGDNSMTSYYQNLRGRSVLVLIDGVAQRSNRNVSRQLTSISPDIVERIEVVNGATALYGAGATGGIINIITKKGQEYGLQGSTSFGFTNSTEDFGFDANTVKLTQSFYGTTENTDYMLTASLERRGDYIDAEGNQIATDPNQVSRDNARTHNILGNFGYQLSDDSHISLSVEHFKERMRADDAADFGDPSPAYLGLPAGLLVPGGRYEPQAREGLNLSQQPETERQSLTLSYNDQSFFGHNLMSQFNVREHDFYYYPYPGVPLMLDVNWSGVLNGALALPPGDVPAALPGLFVANLNGAQASLLQSHINTRVYDFKFALQSDLDDLKLTYGVDLTLDEGKQKGIEYSYTDWLASGQTQFTRTGNTYDSGPEAETFTKALFVQGRYALTDALSLSAGVRYEHATAEVKDFESAIDSVNANHYQSELDDPSLQALAGALGMSSEAFLAYLTNSAAAAYNYQNYITYSDSVAKREGGSKSYSATLFNAGLTYQMGQSELFGNFSQGFTVPDLTRLFRSVTVFSDNGNTGPLMDSTSVDAVKTDSVEFGWRARSLDWDGQVAVFANQSDKNVSFDPTTGVVRIFDETEKIYGLELALNTYFGEGFSSGGSYSYTRGTTKDEAGTKVELGMDRILPQKVTAYLGYQSRGEYDLRLQMQHLPDFDEAWKDRPSTQVDFDGYTTFDFLSRIEMESGSLGFAVHNLANTEYKTVYNQVRGYPATGAATWLPAQGRTVSVELKIEY